MYRISRVSDDDMEGTLMVILCPCKLHAANSRWCGSGYQLEGSFTHFIPVHHPCIICTKLLDATCWPTSWKAFYYICKCTQNKIKKSVYLSYSGKLSNSNSGTQKPAMIMNISLFCKPDYFVPICGLRFSQGRRSRSYQNPIPFHVHLVCTKTIHSDQRLDWISRTSNKIPSGAAHFNIYEA